MSESYQPKEIESKIYEICKNRGYFEINGNARQSVKSRAKAKNEGSSAEPKNRYFSIIMPPPNVTGVLHIGHALTFTLQDIIVRYKRMRGFITLYQPGLDHAGIATQNIVEKQLLAQGIHKEDIGREAFIEKVWQWKEESGGKILEQMQALGVSAAWSRTRFTMDKGLAQAVREAFVAWYERGLIAQGDYMVNWCTHDGALSDIEVEYHEQATNLYYLRYFLAPESNAQDSSAESKNAESSDYLIVATTRPETFFGDTAVMVNPADSRYSHLIGRKVRLPLLNREIPIIADESVDMEFGSGVVKVTPAHDTNDYEVGKRHNLESIIIFDEKGVLNAHAGAFEGQERLEARERIISALEKIDAIEKIEPYTNQVGKCYRCGNIIEPYISKQWFVDKKIAERTIKRVNEGESRFHPSLWLNNFNAWMSELRPWCISRQLWWGHRIPVWNCECGHQFASTKEVESTCPKCGAHTLTQDPDVLDTWFSSGLWAFSTLGWGNGGAQSEQYNADDLEHFYPNSLLITGFDILFFWVARMLFSGESLLGKLPFKDIYLHALVRDEFGQKMSKSRGNVIDPLSVIETHGADSLRFALALACAQGRDVRLSGAQLDQSKNFANKLFNATQFLLIYLKQMSESSAKVDSVDSGAGARKGGIESRAGSAESGASGTESSANNAGDISDFTPQIKELDSLDDFRTPLGRYARSRLNHATSEVISALESYRFNDGASVLYRFLWGEFCDWCIEFAKAQKEAICELASVLQSALKLLHPYMPFLSEALYHRLGGTQLEDIASGVADSIMIASYPLESKRDEALEREFELIMDCIISLRRAKASIELANKPIKAAFIKPKSALKPFAIALIEKLARVESIAIVDKKPNKSVADVGELCEAYLPLEGLDLSGIISRLESQKTKLEKEIAKIEGMLGNEKFLANAPKAVLESNQNALNDARARLAKIHAELESINLN